MVRKIILIGLLGCYGILLFVVLTFNRMPAERMLEDRIRKASDGRLALSVTHLDLGFPDQVRMQGVGFRIASGKGRLEGRVDALRARPDYGGLIRGYVPARIQADMPAGPFQGRVGISLGKGLEKGYASLRTRDFALSRFPAARSLLGRSIKGRLEADLDLRGNLKRITRVEGNGTLRIAGGAVEARLGMPGLDEIPFESLEVAFALNQGKLTLSQAEMKGPAFAGRFQGDIALRDDLKRSRISLRGDLTAGPLVLENAFLGRLLEKVLRGDRSVRVRVGGTLERPTVARIKG